MTKKHLPRTYVNSKSDDPALVMMGLSMVKNYNVDKISSSLIYDIYKIRINSGMGEIKEIALKKFKEYLQKKNKKENYNYKP